MATKTKITKPEAPVIKKAEAKKPAVSMTDWTATELMAEAKKVRSEMATLQVAYFSGKEKNTSKGFNLRKQLAKILTILSQKRV